MLGVDHEEDETKGDSIPVDIDAYAQIEIDWWVLQLLIRRIRTLISY
jgi:hypothetical protein